MEDEGECVTWRKKWVGHLLSFDPEGRLSDVGRVPGGQTRYRSPDNTEAEGVVGKLI